MTGAAAHPGADPRWRWALLAGLVALAFAFQGSRPIFEPDEGRYTDVALEMLRLGDWLHPALNHETPHYTKPPLLYWTVAASVEALGRNTWAVRFPNALAYLLTALLVVRLGRRLAPRDPPLAGAVYATSLLPVVAMNIVSTDTLLTLWETLAMTAFVEARWGDARRARAWTVAGWLGFGLAFATKGPPGLLPLAALVAFLLADEGWRGLRRLASPAGIALFLVVGGGWFAVVVAQRPELVSYFLGGEVVGRIVSARFDRNAQWYGAILVYVPAFVVGGLPWTWTLARGAVAALRRLRSGGRRWLRADPARLLLVLWVLVPLAVFVVARSRLHLYVVPLFVPLALAAARRLAPAFAARPRHRWRAVAAWALLLVALKGGAAHVPHHKDSRALAQAIRAAVPEPFDEVLFVDAWPRYGLSLYLDAEVEEVTSEPTEREPGSMVVRQTIYEELAEPERRVVVLEARDIHDLLPRFVAFGAVPRPRGAWRELRFYTLEGRE